MNTLPPTTVVACLAVSHGLEFYAKHKMVINSSYTPKNMLAFVERHTGQKFKRTQLLEAAKYLREGAGL